MKEMKELARKELIGLDTEISESKNSSNKGIKGKIIDETRNCITIKTERGDKRLIKKNITLRFPGLNKDIKGEMIVGKPEERIKKKAR